MLYVQGHSAAYRYSKMMFSGSLIIKVASTVAAPSLWFFDALHGFSLGGDMVAMDCDHIIVQSDLSDLLDVLEWCETHPTECEQMALNALTIAEQTFTTETICQYWHNLLCQTSIGQTHFITDLVPCLA